MPRLYVDARLAAGIELELPAESAHYARNVLRLESGARLRVFCGDGREFEATLGACARRVVQLVVGAELPPLAESPLAVHLGLALVRGERMDWAVQKATELGVASIAPLALARCTARLDAQRGDNRLRHWRQVAIAAAEQSGRARVPIVAAAQSLPEWLAAHTGIPGVVLHTGATARLGTPPGAAGNLCLLVGPEGGLDERELGQAIAAGFHACSLGPRVLRAETAPLVALAILQHLGGDL